jgi:hypothetical protein
MHDTNADPDPSWLQGALDACSRAAAPLSLAVTVLLFLQWPLRDWIGAWSTQANDLAQWLFALYVAVALRHAGERGAHLVARPDLAETGAGRAARMRRVGAPLCVLPWALFIVISPAQQVAHSVANLELFPDTFNPGYFMIKLALVLLGLLIAVQAVLDLRRALRQP